MSREGDLCCKAVCCLGAQHRGSSAVLDCVWISPLLASCGDVRDVQTRHVFLSKQQVLIHVEGLP